MTPMDRPVWNAPGDGRIDNGHVHLWMSRKTHDLGSPVPSGLSAVERQRCATYRSADDEMRCRARRGLLRRVLARYLGRAPSDVELRVRPGGKPQLGGEAPGNLSFSVSSSKDIVLVSIARGIEIGVDVEVVHELPELSQLAKLALADDELRELHQVDQVSPRDTGRWFLQRWTVKEAILKASGEGLRLDPRHVAITRNKDVEIVGRLLAPDVNPSGWFVTELDVARDAVAAVASDGRPAAIEYFQDQW
jgi:4'-phosphopantetheinyl transferase